MSHRSRRERWTEYVANMCGIDLPPARKKKRTYWPELMPLEDRMLPSISVTTSAITPTTGVPWPWSSQVATFTDSGGLQPASSYYASIDWGDGQTSQGVVTTGLTGVVGGPHTYLRGGSYTVTATVSRDGVSGNNSNTATVTISDYDGCPPFRNVCHFSSIKG